MSDLKKLKKTIMDNTNSTTIGEQRVRTSINPSKTDSVDLLKQKSAELINLCEDLKPKDGSMMSSEKARLISLAQTTFEEASMWAVKAATF